MTHTNSHRHGELELGRHGNRSRQVGDEEHRALQHGDQQQILAGGSGQLAVVVADLLPSSAMRA